MAIFETEIFSSMATEMEKANLELIQAGIPRLA